MTVSCRACRKSRLEPFLDLGALPLAGGFLRDASEISAERRFPLVVHVCLDCGLLQIVEPIAPDVLFKHYYFSASTVGPLLDHFKAYADFIATTLGAKKVVEFGCNDGILLGPLRERGVAAIGVDFSENITAIARAKGLDVVTGAFDPACADAIRARAGAVDFVTGSNCFAHNDQPDPILEAARRLLAPSGLLGLEVLYAGDLLEKLQWDSLYHEHLNTYSLGSLTTLLARNGFRVVDAFRLPMHAGSLRVLASPDPTRAASPRVAALAAEEARVSLNDAATWRRFGATVRRTIAVVTEIVADLAARRRIWAYGASGRAAMWLSACNMDYIERVVDASPLRAGTLMPGTHQPVVLPEELRRTPPDCLFVTAWNYLDVIRAKERWYQGVWITPAPRFEFL